MVFRHDDTDSAAESRKYEPVGAPSLLFRDPLSFAPPSSTITELFSPKKRQYDHLHQNHLYPDNTDVDCDDNDGDESGKIRKKKKCQLPLSKKNPSRVAPFTPVSYPGHCSVPTPDPGPVDPESTSYPPQPWGRRPPNERTEKQKDRDASYIVDLLDGADRARTRWMFRSCLSYQKWDGDRQRKLLPVGLGLRLEARTTTKIVGEQDDMNNDSNHDINNEEKSNAVYVNNNIKNNESTNEKSKDRTKIIAGDTNKDYDKDDNIDDKYGYRHIPGGILEDAHHRLPCDRRYERHIRRQYARTPYIFCKTRRRTKNSKYLKEEVEGRGKKVEESDDSVENINNGSNNGNIDTNDVHENEKDVVNGKRKEGKPFNFNMNMMRLPLKIATRFRKERRNCLPLERYTAPFSRSCVRYALASSSETEVGIMDRCDDRIYYDGENIQKVDAKINMKKKGERKRKEGQNLKKEEKGEEIRKEDEILSHTTRTKRVKKEELKIKKVIKFGKEIKVDMEIESEKYTKPVKSIKERNSSTDVNTHKNNRNDNENQDGSISENNFSTNVRSIDHDSNDINKDNNRSNSKNKNEKYRTGVRLKYTSPTDPPPTTGSPSDYGNCLLLVPCPCTFCRDDNINRSKKISILFHPLGQGITMSRIVVSSDGDSGIACNSDDHHTINTDTSAGIKKRTKIRSTIDLGGKILQISPCFDVDSILCNTSRSTTNTSLNFVVRTPSHCSVVSCILHEAIKDREDQGQGQPKNNSAQSLKQERIPNSVRREQHSCCSGTYQLVERARLDLRHEDDVHTLEDERNLNGNVSIIKSSPWYIPIDVATQMTTPAMNSPGLVPTMYTFAVLHQTCNLKSSKSCHNELGTNVVHLVHYNNAELKCERIESSPSTSLITEKYVVKDLVSISNIVYTRYHPMVLWCTGRSSNIHYPLRGNRRGRRSTIGYGHSLYKIDLRYNSATFVWSPSASDFLQDGVHSISSLMPDKSNPHYVYVTSTSACGRTWLLDCGSTPATIVCTWVLPGIASDLPSMRNSAGIYGHGTILAQPLSLSRPQRYGFSSGNCKVNNINNNDERIHIDVPVISVAKNPGTASIALYQRPTTQARFHTRCIEYPSGTDVDYPLIWEENTGNQSNTTSKGGMASIAISSSLTLPDAASPGGIGGNGTSFVRGITAFFHTGISNDVPKTIKWPKKETISSFETLLADSDNYDCNQTKVEGVDVHNTGRSKQFSFLLVVSLNSLGDVHAHTLLQSKRSQSAKSNTFEGLPVGTRAIPAKNVRQHVTSTSCNLEELHWSVSNTFPIPGRTVGVSHVASKHQCRPFRTIPLHHIQVNNGVDDINNRTEEETEEGERKRVDISTTLINKQDRQPVYIIPCDPTRLVEKDSSHSIPSCLPLMLDSRYIKDCENNVCPFAYKESTTNGALTIKDEVVEEEKCEVENDKGSPIIESELRGADISKLDNLWEKMIQ